MAGEYNYVAVRMLGTGAGEVVHTEVPLAAVSLTDLLAGPPEMSATVPPQYAKMLGKDKRPLFGSDEEWGLALFAEVDGNLMDEGGVMTECVPQADGSYSLTVRGLTHAWSEQPYTEDISFVREDILNIYRHIIDHVQAQPRGDVGLTVDPLLSGILLGTPDSEESGNEGPFRLNPWSTTNLGAVIDDLAERGFDWHETHRWEGNSVAHHVQLGVPVIGYRRNDGDLVVGENVPVRPAYASAGPEYASDVLVLGAGEGRAMVTGHASRSVGKIRRVAVVSDKRLQTNSDAFNRALRELGERTTLPSVSSIVVEDSGSAPLLSYRVGDEVPYIDPDRDLLINVRILSRTIEPSRADRATLTVARTDVGVM